MSRIAQDLASSAIHPRCARDDGDMQPLRRAAGKMPEVAIIGAGVSGLRCADTLLRAGVKVTILEARDRVGGRLHQRQSAGHLMDMGANWIHGTNGNPISKLAAQTQTTVVEPDEGSVVFDKDGIKRSSEESSKMSATMWRHIVDAFENSDAHSSSIDAKTSLQDYFKQKVSEDVKDPDTYRDDMDESRMWGQFIGAPIERQSLKFFFLEQCIDGENVFVASTYQRVLAEISRAALEAGVVKLNTEVTTVDLGGEKISVGNDSGKLRKYDEVVVTCPLGWLKQNHSSVFRPPLPQRLGEAIANISYGRLEKVYISFPIAFWLENNDVSSYPTFTHFHPPISHPAAPSSANLSDWNQSMVSLAHMPVPHNHPTLLFYIYGDCGAHVVNTIKDLDPQSQKYADALIAIFKPFYSKLPNYSSSAPSCTPASLLATTWQADKYAGNGSYSNFQVGLTEADKDIECMRNAGGLTERGLWLAGEHTAPFIALGTTTGAWWSGEAVARRICDKYGLKINDTKIESMNGVVKDLNTSRKKPDAAQSNGFAL